MTNIAVPCGRADLFALYGTETSLPVVGWDERGRAIVQKLDGSTVLASRARVGAPFVCVEVDR